jgi:hypothetical protein
VPRQIESRNIVSRRALRKLLRYASHDE